MAEIAEPKNEEKDYTLPQSRLVLYGVKLVRLPVRKESEGAVHILSEFDEILLEKRREFLGKWAVFFLLVSGGFFLWQETLPKWCSAPFFFLAVLIVIAWFTVGFRYLVLRKNGKTVEYRLRDTPMIEMDFFENLKNNVLKVNASARIEVMSKLK